jgi:DNA-binding MarR family transcriptional regulator
MEERMEQNRRPIGYWLKHVDRLIEETFERTLGDDGLTRRHWQVLNTLDAGPTTAGALAVALEPFVGDDTAGIDRVIDDLARRGWLHRPDGRVQLSHEGRSAHTRIKERVAATRQRLRAGITDDEYLHVIAILERMAANLEPEAASRVSA